MKLDAESIKTGAKWLGATTGAGLPAMSFFTSLPPPLFPKVSILTSALAAAILFIVAVSKPKQDTGVLPRAVALGTKCLAWALPLLIAYVLLLQFTTVRSPQNDISRYQIGFGMVDWTLTSTGSQWKQSHPDITAKEVLMNEAAFDQEAIGRLWHTWTIYLAGLILILSYFFGFLCWTTGFALLAKQRNEVGPEGGQLAEVHLTAASPRRAPAKPKPKS